LSAWLTEQGFAVGVLAGGPQIVEAFAVIGPACLVLDMDADGMNGFEVLAEFRRCHAGIPVIVLSAQADVPRVVRAMRLGAFDFLPKPHDPEELRQAIGWALQQAGAMQDSPSAAELIRQRLATLTPRERDVLQSVAHGCLNKQVASELGLALVTVKVHRASAMRKLGVKTAAELGRVAELLAL
jgi:FixJ family two-component response regulator